MTPYMASDRTKHEIAINNVLSRKDKFHIHLAKAAFEKNRTYAAKYIVACKGQRPKTGYIDIKTTNNSATVEHHPYSNRPQVTKYLKRKIKDMFSSEPYVYLFGDELHVFENGVVFTAFAKCKGNQRIDIADLTISLYEDAIAPEKQFDSYEYACKMLEPGERHQIILPLNIGDRNIHDVKYSIEQDTSCGNKEKLDDVTYDIDTDWILNDWDGVGKPATPLELTVSNDYSMTTCHCFVNIKFYDESDTVVFVSSDYIELNPETSKQVHVNDLRDEQLLEQIVDYDVLITGNPIVLVEDRP
ncbi:hypothetical protein A4G99_12540 [Haladaptatus sp. R4]|nr:hypothetical protein A4G99_12540 [Haladaptatus sp. R4]